MDIGTIAINLINILSSQFIPLRSISLRARPILPARQDQYRLERCCVRCGLYNHWVKKCPLQLYSCPLWLYKKETAKRIPASNQGSDKSDLDIDEEISRLQRGEI